MKTEKNKNVAYETPVMETVELVLEGAVLDNSPGGNAGGGTDEDIFG
jgi:hypothetical protein